MFDLSLVFFKIKDRNSIISVYRINIFNLHCMRMFQSLFLILF